MDVMYSEMTPRGESETRSGMLVTPSYTTNANAEDVMGPITEDLAEETGKEIVGSWGESLITGGQSRALYSYRLTGRYTKSQNGITGKSTGRTDLKFLRATLVYGKCDFE